MFELRFSASQEKNESEPQEQMLRRSAERVSSGPLCSL
jgi:hypothetical protein